MEIKVRPVIVAGEGALTGGRMREPLQVKGMFSILIWVGHVSVHTGKIPLTCVLKMCAFTNPYVHFLIKK